MNIYTLADEMGDEVIARAKQAQRDRLDAAVRRAVIAQQEWIELAAAVATREWMRQARAGVPDGEITLPEFDDMLTALRANSPVRTALVRTAHQLACVQIEDALRDSHGGDGGSDAW